MSDRNLPNPDRALQDLLSLQTRKLGETRLRQRWSGKVRTFPDSTVPGNTRTSFSPDGFDTVGVGQLDPGAWVVLARVILSVENSITAQWFTGRETAQVRLYQLGEDQSLLEELDLSFAAPASTPEPFWGSGFLDLQMNMFGFITSDAPLTIAVIAQVWDTEQAAHPVTWRTKMMALPF